MKAVKAKLQETNPDQVDAFEKGAAAYAKKIVAQFKDYEFVSLCDIHTIYTNLVHSTLVHR